MPRPHALFLASVLLACDAASPAPTPGDAPSGPGGKADSIDGDAPKPGAFVELDRREYKLPLDARRFADDPDLALAQLWHDVQDAAVEADAEVLEGFDEVVTRQVTLLDVPGACTLRQQGFVLRHRVEDDDAELTLKLRSPDRYVAAYAALGADDPDDARDKLEEDITPGFRSKFSRSVTVAAERDVGELEDPLDAFVGWVHEVVPPTADLHAVGGATFDELVVEGATVRVADEKKAHLELTLWSLEPYGDPVVAELSFSYDVDGEHDFEIATGMLALFEALQRRDGWVTDDGDTKTAFAYARDPGFCD
jgi:hypothetical protein